MPADVVEHATAGRKATPTDIPASAASVPPEPRGWRARLRAFAESVREVWHDESSGSGTPEHGFFTRTLLAARDLLHAKRTHDRDETGHAARETVEPARDAGKSFVERVLERGRAMLHDDRGCVPIDHSPVDHPSMENPPPSDPLSGHPFTDDAPVADPYAAMLAAQQSDAPDLPDPVGPFLPPLPDAPEPDTPNRDGPDLD